MNQFEERVKSLWSNPKGIDLDVRFLYFIAISDKSGIEYRYIGKARNKSRLHEYQNNMKKIQIGRERGVRQNYRAIHFAMYSALKNDWEIDFSPLENCNSDNVDSLEQQRIRELKCNLNGARTWRVADINSITVQGLFR